MSDWLNKWCTLVISLIVISTSFTSNVHGSVVCSTKNEACLNPLITCDNLLENIPEDSPSLAIKALSADYVACADQNDSYLNWAAESKELIEDIVSGMYSCGNKAVETLGALLRVARSGLSAAQKHPLKALTMFLAMQCNNSSFKMPGAKGLTVSNLEQSLTYVPDGPAVDLLPMIITPSNKSTIFPSYKIEIYPSDAGIPSSFVGIPSSSIASLYKPAICSMCSSCTCWQAGGNLSQTNAILSTLSFKPAAGYQSAISITTWIIENLSLLSSKYALIFMNPSISDIMVTNLDQTIPYDASSLSIPLLPIIINSSLSEFSLSISCSCRRGAGNLTSLANSSPLTYTDLDEEGGIWSAQGNKSEVNRLLSNLYFKPSISLYPSIIKLVTKIRDTRTRPTTRVGILTIKPSSLIETSISAITAQSTSIVVTNSSNVSSSSATQSQKITTPNFSSTHVTQSSLPTTGDTGTAILANTNRSTSLSIVPNSTLVTSPSSLYQIASNVTESSDSVTFPTASISNKTTDTTGEINSSEIVHLVSAREIPYALIGGVLGGIALCTSMVVGLVYYVRKKYSSGQQPKDGLPVRQAPTGGGGSEKQYQNPTQHSGQYDVSAVQAPINSSYTTLPIASPRYVNSQAMQPNDVPQSGVPLKTFYSFLPVKGHYETSLPRTPNYNEAYSTLHKAAAEGDCSTIEVFLGFNVPIDSIDEEGYTPLHLAAQAGKEGACNLLLQRGANKNLSTKEGKTALVLAQEMGHHQIVVLLT